MRKKKLILLTGILALTLDTSIIYATGSSEEKEILTAGITQNETSKSDGLQITNDDLKGRWVTATIETEYAASFDENGDCHITMYSDGEKKDLCIQADGTISSLKEETGGITSFHIRKSDTALLYYTETEDNDIGLLFPDGIHSDCVYLLEMESELFISEDKFISVEYQKAYDYEIIDNAICCFREDEVLGYEILFCDRNLFICQDIKDQNVNPGQFYDAMVCIKKNWLE